MKLKYHKIGNVPLTVCTAEQKMAYNIAFYRMDRYKKAWLAQKGKVCEAARGLFISEVTQYAVEVYKREINRYDIDGVISAFRAGIRNYFEHPSGILWSYEEIGKMFPAHYL